MALNASFSELLQSLALAEGEHHTALLSISSVSSTNASQEVELALRTTALAAANVEIAALNASRSSVRSAAASGEVLNSGGGVIRMGAVGKAVLEELPRAAAASAGAAGGGAGGEAAHVGSAHVSGFNVSTTHHCAASLTSTAVPLSTKNTAAAETEEDRRAARSASIAALGKKGLVRVLGIIVLNQIC